MNNYSRAVKDKAYKLFNLNFNSISFDLLKKSMGEDGFIDYIEKPSEDTIFNEWLENQNEEELRIEFNQGRSDDWHIEDDYPDDDEGFRDWLKDQYQNEIEDYSSEMEWYPMWNTIFEAKDNFLSEKIMENIDKLYEFGIGVISPTDDLLACLFIAGAGYDFYDAHWIPMLEYFEWLNIKEIEKKEKEKEENFVDDNFIFDISRLSEKTTDKNIKRHAKGLYKALKALKTAQ